jgi:hypothetical protein
LIAKRKRVNGLKGEPGAWNMEHGKWKINSVPKGYLWGKMKTDEVNSSIGYCEIEPWKDLKLKTESTSETKIRHRMIQ